MHGSDLIRAASPQGRISGTGVDQESKAPRQTAATAWRKGSFASTWRGDDSKLARHRNLPLLKPAPLAIRRPQAFSEEKRICRVRRPPRPSPALLNAGPQPKYTCSCPGNLSQTPSANRLSSISRQARPSSTSPAYDPVANGQRQASTAAPPP